MSQEQRIQFMGLKHTIDDFFAVLKYDGTMIMEQANPNPNAYKSFSMKVKSIEKVSGYYSFWHIEGYAEGTKPITIYVDYYGSEEATGMIGGFGYFELSEA